MTYRGRWEPEIAAMRRVLSGLPMKEVRKWGKPTFTVDGKNVVIMQDFKEYFGLGFFQGALLKDPRKALVQLGQVYAGRVMKFTSVKDITAKAATIKAYVREAIAVEQAGLRMKPKKATDYPVPEELTQRFRRDPRFKRAFEALTPGRQRGYHYHFAAAKQPATRVARIEKAIAAIFEGRGFMERPKQKRMKSIARLSALLLVAMLPSLLAAQGGATGPYPRPAGTHAVDIERGVMVPMRDGVRLATDIYRPKDLDGPLPTVLIRTPYNKSASPAGDASANFFASHGYAVVVQDVRGKFASEGTFRVYGGEMTDWSDVFDWIGKQPWSTGHIGTYGCSYLGEGQIIAAQQHHPLHYAAIAQAAGGNLGRVPGQREFWGSVEGGTSALSINFGWMPIYASLDKGARAKPAVDIGTFLKTLPLIDMTDRAGSPSWDWRNFLERSPDDPWWDAQGYLTTKAQISTPTLHTSSWFDMAGNALEELQIFRTNATNANARDGQYAIISPTVHCSSERAGSQTMVGALPVGDARLHYFDIYLAWFDRWLRGNEHALDSLPHFQYYVIGRNEWHHSDQWPVPGMQETTWFLHSGGAANTLAGDGRLDTKAPGKERADTFSYDPANPVPARGGTVCCTGNPRDVGGSFDNTDIEQRPDVLVYTTEVLREGMELTGSMRAAICLSSDALDTDVTVKLVDVFPDGRAMNMQDGITRARYRDGFGAPQMMTAGKVYQVPVDLHATSWFLPAGHKLRVEVSSSNFPRYDRNLNTGGHNYDETTWRIAKNAVHHTPACASKLVLPVVR